MFLSLLRSSPIRLSSDQLSCLFLKLELKSSPLDLRFSSADHSADHTPASSYLYVSLLRGSYTREFLSLRKFSPIPLTSTRLHGGRCPSFQVLFSWSLLNLHLKFSPLIAPQDLLIFPCSLFSPYSCFRSTDIGF